MILQAYSFLFTRKFREFLFLKGVLIYQEKTNPRSNHFLGNYDWEVDISLNISTGELFLREYLFIYGDTSEPLHNSKSLSQINKKLKILK